jgi:hypothetical protein
LYLQIQVVVVVVVMMMMMMMMCEWLFLLVCTVESWCSCTMYRTFTYYNHFNPVVLTYCEWLWQIRIKPCGWWFSFSHSPAVLSFMTSCLSLSDVDCLCASGRRLSISYSMCFMVLKVFVFK